VDKLAPGSGTSEGVRPACRGCLPQGHLAVAAGRKPEARRHFCGRLRASRGCGCGRGPRSGGVV